MNGKLTKFFQSAKLGRDGAIELVIKQVKFDCKYNNGRVTKIKSKQEQDKSKSNIEEVSNK
jgi:hypothetical protein